MLELIAVYLLGGALSCVFFIFLDKWTGPHYGYGSSTDDRVTSIVARSLFWPIGLPGTLCFLLFGAICAFVEKFVKG